MRKYKFTEKFTEYVVKQYDYNMKLAAKEIGCSYETLRRNVKKYNIPMKNRYKKNRQPNRKSSSKFQTWVKENGDAWKILSYSELAKQSGCTYKTVWSYMKHKRVKAEKLVASKPWDNCTEDIVLTSFEGVDIPNTAFKTVKTYIHNKTGEIKLHVTLHTGQEHDFVYDVDVLARLYN